MAYRWQPVWCFLFVTNSASCTATYDVICSYVAGRHDDLPGVPPIPRSDLGGRETCWYGNTLMGIVPAAAAAAVTAQQFKHHMKQDQVYGMSCQSITEMKRSMTLHQTSCLTKPAVCCDVRYGGLLDITHTHTLLDSNRDCICSTLHWVQLHRSFRTTHSTLMQN